MIIIDAAHGMRTVVNRQKSVGELGRSISVQWRRRNAWTVEKWITVRDRRDLYFLGHSWIQLLKKKKNAEQNLRQYELSGDAI